jgi:hypothetical protein
MTESRFIEMTLELLGAEPRFRQEMQMVLSAVGLNEVVPEGASADRLPSDFADLGSGGEASDREERSGADETETRLSY